MEKQNIQDLDALFGDVIVELGIGGYVPTADILRIYNPISAELFSSLAYASDYAVFKFKDDPIQATRAENLVDILSEQDFSQKTYFEEVAEMFRNRFPNDFAL